MKLPVAYLPRIDEPRPPSERVYQITRLAAFRDRSCDRVQLGISKAVGEDGLPMSVSMGLMRATAGTGCRARSEFKVN